MRLTRCEFILDWISTEKLVCQLFQERLSEVDRESTHTKAMYAAFASLIVVNAYPHSSERLLVGAQGDFEVIVHFAKSLCR